jgi:hypothetical protein
MKRIFVSYARADQAIAGRIVDFLRRAGFEVWWDQEMAGEVFNAEIKGRIEQAAVVICLLSPSFLASAYCDGEMSAARPDALLPIDIAPIAHADVPIPLKRFNRLSLVAWVQGGDPDAPLALIDACRRRLGEAPSSPPTKPATSPATPQTAAKPSAGEGGVNFNIAGDVGVAAKEISGGSFNVSVGKDKSS